MRSIFFGSVLVFVLVSDAFCQWDMEVLFDRSGRTDSAAYGYRVIPLGDQNDDGYDDWAIEANYGYNLSLLDRGYVEIFLGADPVPEEAFLTFQRPYDYMDNLGGLMNLGDVNGDGYDDFCTGGGLYYEPGAWIWRTLFFLGGPDLDTIPDFERTAKRWFFTVGDFNGDNFDDYIAVSTQEGIWPSLDLYYGGVEFDSIPDWVIHDPYPQAHYGVHATHGDVNGDGYSDFSSSGDSLLIFFGGEEPDTIPDLYFTDCNRIYILPDINADGYDDILGYTNPAPVYLGGRGVDNIADFYIQGPSLGVCPHGLGRSGFATAGDVNGDGVNDFLFAGEDCYNGWGWLQLNLGYFWINEDPVDRIFGRDPPLWLIGIAPAGQGFTGVGDINGDGLDDVAIGATNWDVDGTRGRVVILSGDSELTVSAEQRPVPETYELSIVAYPNPFNASTRIVIDGLRTGEAVELHIYNILGQEVGHFQETATADRFSFIWNTATSGTSLPGGVYFCHVRAPARSQTLKLLLIR